MFIFLKLTQHAIQIISDNMINSVYIIKSNKNDLLFIFIYKLSITKELI